MLRLRNRVQNYDWGSRTALAELLRRPSPSEHPEAELWMGTHPLAPSEVFVDGGWTSLGDVVARAPSEEIGEAGFAAFGARLPFMLKIIAAESPLSLQVHPNSAQARAGFEGEEALGTPRQARTRNYRDPWHKPELICALTPFQSFVGFRGALDVLRAFDALGASELEPWLAPLRAHPEPSEVRRLFERLLSAPSADACRLSGAVAAAAARSASRDGEVGEIARRSVTLGELFPGDPGLVTVWMMNWVRLEPMEALYLPAGCLHAYVGGVGIELMASSDNVLRAGLTTKHIDVPELLRVLEFDAEPPEKARTRRDGVETFYESDAREFRLSRVDLPEPGSYRPRASVGCEILIALEGRFELMTEEGGSSPSAALSSRSVVLDQGESVFISARDGAYAAHGKGRLFRAALGDCRTV